MPTRERTEKSKAKAAGAATKPRGKAPAGYPNWSEALADWTDDAGGVRPGKRRKQPQPQPQPRAAAASSSAQPTQPPSDPFVPADIGAVLSKFGCGDGGPAEREELEGLLESWLARGGNANAVVRVPGDDDDDPSGNPTILQHMALDAHHYSLRAFELLTQHGADVDAPRISVHCRTPLWNAVQSVVAATRGGWGEACSVGVVSILLRAGARDPEALWDMYRLVCVPTPVADLYDQMVELHD